MPPKKSMMVKIYDFNTKTTTQIPASELAPGMIRAIMDGIDEPVGGLPNQVQQ